MSFLAYGDLGSQTGQDITGLARELHRRGSLGTLYCRGTEERLLPEHAVVEPIPFGRTVPRLLSGVSRITNERFDSRYYSEELFDRFAARRLDDVGIHLHHTPGYVRSLRRARDAGHEVVVKATTEYSLSAQERLRREYDRLGLEIDIPKTHRRTAAKRRKTLEDCDRILALSSFVKQSLVEGGFPAKKIQITPLGINAEDYPKGAGEPDGQFSVLYVGSISVAKGIHYLLEAWRMNGWDTDKDAQLVLCGRIFPPMTDLLRRYDIPNLTTPGVVDPRPYYQGATIFAFPSLSEGFAKAPLEAMASGLPVVVTDHSGTDEIITNGREGYVIPAGECLVLAEKLRYLRERPNLRSEMRRHARQTACAQTWTSHADLVLEHIGL